ncbi:MAG: carboxypeptidase regulatory-like domain-containing protein [Pyrinomonadaceae bacterium]|nr:carboxypeptidase regulatory-like domain-containing protein [Pyrinomonadaceae bacterium]
MNTSHLFTGYAHKLTVAFGAASGLFMALIIAGAFTTPSVGAQTPITTEQEAAVTDSQNLKRGNSTVKGRAVYDDTGRPVRRARVTLVDPNERAKSRMGATDGRGEFRIERVAAGKYYAAVEAPGVLSLMSFYDFGDSTSEQIIFEQSKSYFEEVSVNGTSDVEVKIRARRGGVITGKVTYADGDPAINAQISVWRKSPGAQGAAGRLVQVLTVFGGGRARDALWTDDRGVYRVPGLAPGEYYVSAAEADSPEVEEGKQVIHREGQASLNVTYHPAAINSHSASPVRVEAARETGDINITVAERSTHKLAGKVVARRDGQPLKRAMVSLQSGDESAVAFPFFGDQVKGTDDQGRWSFGEVPDGTYTVTIEPPYEPPPPAPAGDAQAAARAPRKLFAAKQQEIVIAGADLADVTIEMSEGGRISGTVQVEGGKPLPPNVYVTTRSAGAGRMMMFRPQARVEAEGKWTLEGVPAGDAHLSAGVMPDDNKFYTKSITLNGRDVAGEPIKVSEGGTVSGVRVVISSEVATLAGRALAAQDGKPLRGGVVALVPADPGKWRSRDAFLYGNISAEGAFTVNGAPGEYLVVVWQSAEAAPAFDEEYIKARVADAPRVTLRTGERKSLDLTVPPGK